MVGVCMPLASAEHPAPYCTQRIRLKTAHILVHDVLKCLVQIKMAYREQAKELHPDLNPSAGAAQHARFAEVSEAYQVRTHSAYDICDEVNCFDTFTLASARLVFAALFELSLGHPQLHGMTGMHAACST